MFQSITSVCSVNVCAANAERGFRHQIKCAEWVDAARTYVLLMDGVQARGEKLI